MGRLMPKGTRTKLVSSALVSSALGGSGIERGLKLGLTNSGPLASGRDLTVPALAFGWLLSGPVPGPLGWLPFIVPWWINGLT